MTLKFATICFAALLAGAAGSHALTFEGTISGSITAADNASFLMFGNNTPLAVGDTITGHYSYESPTVDVSFPTPINNPQFTIHFGTINLNFFPIWFDVSGGHIDRLVWALDSNSFPGEPEYSSHMVISENSLSIIELIGSEPMRSAGGSLIFSDPVTPTVPDTAATGPLFIFVLGTLCFFRKHFNQV